MKTLVYYFIRQFLVGDENGFDTIAAISTFPGEAGIGIVRLSGDDALEIISKILNPISLKI